MKIITKIRNGNFNFVENKGVFLELIQEISIAIYKCKTLNEKFNEEYYDETRDYCDEELKCCNNVKQYLNK